MQNSVAAQKIAHEVIQNSALSFTENPYLPTIAMAPATCGELIQGAIDNQDFLVNCPIDKFSRVTLVASDRAGVSVREAGRHQKIIDAIEYFSKQYALNFFYELSIESDIPRGKGMASSTADITAALLAVCRRLNISISDDDLFRVLVRIEPSDATHYPGIAYINHLTGLLNARFPAPKNLRVIVVDCGGEVDTLSFDRELARDVYRRHQMELRLALEALRIGLNRGINKLIASATTISACLNQSILYKPQFDDLSSLTRELGALGVNCAHSGTVLGVLYEPRGDLSNVLIDRIESTFGSSVEIIGDHNIISGGCIEQ